MDRTGHPKTWHTAGLEREEAQRGASEASGWVGLWELEPGLRRLLESRCPDENDVDDVIQETYLRAARYRSSVEDPGRLRAWASRIALNVLSDLRGRASRFQALPGGEEGGESALPAALVTEEDESIEILVAGTWLPDEDALDLLEAALGGLRAGDRALLAHYYRDDCDVPECARRIGIPARLVKVRLYRARQRLQARAEWILSRRQHLRGLEVAS